MSGYQDKTQVRNYLWISSQLQELIAKTQLLIIGCGGNGVAFIINAVHLGFRQFILCDPDKLTESNLNRYIIALPSQVGTYKVKIIKSYLAKRFPNTQVKCVKQRFPNNEIIAVLPSTTFVIGCLDNEFTRIELDVLCRKYGRTLIDLGSGFAVDKNANGLGIVSRAGGQVFISRPRGACLRCLGFDNGVPTNYFITEESPEPSSLLINQIISTLAVECVLNELLDKLIPINSIEYDRGTFSIKKAIVNGKDSCQICRKNSIEHLLSVAEKEPLFSALEKAAIKCKTA